MKKIILLALTSLIVGCNNGSEPTKGMYDIYVETIKGHEYIVVDGMYGIGIIHSESCPCKQNQKGQNV